jgi:hypothetical protein
MNTSVIWYELLEVPVTNSGGEVLVSVSSFARDFTALNVVIAQDLTEHIYLITPALDVLEERSPVPAQEPIALLRAVRDVDRGVEQGWAERVPLMSGVEVAFTEVALIIVILLKLGSGSFSVGFASACCGGGAHSSLFNQRRAAKKLEQHRGGPSNVK